MISRTTAAVIAALALVAPLSIGAVAHAEKSPVYTGRLNSLAAGGKDVVAYFKQGQPVAGSKSFTTEYQGATWRFASQENLDAFKASPAAYAPQYGGYCAWAVSQGYTAPGSPDHWTIRGGKLYLNYNGKVQKDWLKDPDGFIRKADVNWPSVLSN